MFSMDMKIRNNNESNSIGVIGGNGYTICSGSYDETVRIWDIEKTKQLNVFKGHEYWIRSVKYGSNELMNTILSGSSDKSIRLWDIRSGKQIQMFNGHANEIWAVEYSPFVIKNRMNFWDIRSNKKELHVIRGSNTDYGIFCLKFAALKKKEQKLNNCCVHLYYGSCRGAIQDIIKIRNLELFLFF
ncbi:WD repeat-containing protein [Reticulomyxa filosa]|uniref:WD repeat-containing protein n=1 Tax=Reticulomyxa filosa TaxID=46433 RepID=X6PA69_RETFI|nr:WD repeat-containing protein [Reticulomyxa filosa]|eukprot:ETO35028.1 WD repeat-containing protein [Reticulomyxa filosa]